MYWWNPTYGITYKIPFRSTAGILTERNGTERNGKFVPDNGTGYNPKNLVGILFHGYILRVLIVECAL